MAKCNRCNRTLKNPEAIRLGYGKVCYRKMMAEREMGQEEYKQMQLSETQYPLDESIVAIRDASGNLATNVPSLVTHHSPTGFEIAYGGSGPADFALNIVENLLRRIGYNGQTTSDTWDKRRIFSKSWELHQDFKWQFVASLPKDGGAIPTNEAIAWIEHRLETQKSLF